MKNNLPGSLQLSFHELRDLFTKKSENVFVIEPGVGEGSVEIFDLEKGLQAMLWNCHFKWALELFNDESILEGKPYYTLAFFKNIYRVELKKNNQQDEDISWGMVFLSSCSTYQLSVPALLKWSCVSISFSRDWLKRNLMDGNEEFKKVQAKIDATPDFIFKEQINGTEMRQLEELLGASLKKNLGHFFIRSEVLKVLSDFFSKLKNRENFGRSAVCLDAIIVEVEKYLCDNLSASLPNLKDLAIIFNVSESTLKRHFKKKFGMNMSTYFLGKKMEYANRLIHDSNTSVAEAASILGYRNLYHFSRTLQK